MECPHPYSKFRLVLSARWLTLDEVLKVDPDRWQRLIVAQYMAKKD